MASAEVSSSLKSPIESSLLNAVPSKFIFPIDPTALTSDSLPVIDFSALISEDQDLRSKALQDLDAACRDWGFFSLVNHGIPETLMNATLTALKEFLRLPESERKAKSDSSGPVKTGFRSITDGNNKTFTLWRDFIKFFLHPKFDWLQQPQLIREVGLDYTRETRKLAIKLMEALCDALELDQRYADEVLKLDSSSRIFDANYYPPCPQPNQAIGMPTHSDPGLLTFLIHNGVAGLQIEHKGQWYDADSPQNSILVNIADQLEIFSNGRYKSVKHRAVLNEEKERISIVMFNGPSPEAVVGPAAPLVEKDGRALYYSMKYEDYVEKQQTDRYAKTLLERQLI